MKILFSILLVTCFALSACKEEVKPKCKTCSDFNTQTEAKNYSNSNPDCAGNLDADNDGIPCESLPK